MKLTTLLTVAVIALGTVALGDSALASLASLVPDGLAGSTRWWGEDTALDRPTVIFGAGVGVLALTAGFLALRVPDVLRRW